MKPMKCAAPWEIQSAGCKTCIKIRHQMFVGVWWIKCILFSPYITAALIISNFLRDYSSSIKVKKILAYLYIIFYLLLFLTTSLYSFINEFSDTLNYPIKKKKKVVEEFINSTFSMSTNTVTTDFFCICHCKAIPLD